MKLKYLSLPCIRAAVDTQEDLCTEFVFSRNSLVTQLASSSIRDTSSEPAGLDRNPTYPTEMSSPYCLDRSPINSVDLQDSTLDEEEEDNEPEYAELEAVPGKCGDMSTCPFEYAGCGWSYNCVTEHLEQNVGLHLQLLMSHSKRQEETIAALEQKVEDATASTNGILIWRISNLSRKMMKSNKCEGMELLSSPFYTSMAGYKLQASLFLTGNGVGENTHLSLYIKMLPGQFDSILSWPFLPTISFSLLDQSNDRKFNLVESFIPNPNWTNFNKPSLQNVKEKLGFGFPKFAPLNILTNSDYVKRDTMFVKIVVDSDYGVMV